MINQCLWQMALLVLLIGCLATQRVQAQCTGVAIEDSLELVKFYNATNGDNWSNNKGWLEAPVRQWKGITLTANSCHVEEISLGINNLEGVLIDLKLPSLITLQLLGNELFDNIPDFNNLPKLETISLGSNELSGTIPDFSNLPNLSRIDLNNNALSGAIPDFSNLSNLETLTLQENNLSGVIPNFSKLPNLATTTLPLNMLLMELTLW